MAKTTMLRVSHEKIHNKIRNQNHIHSQHCYT